MTKEQKQVLTLNLEMEMAKSTILIAASQNIEFSSARVMVEDQFREAKRMLISISISDTMSIPREY